MRSLSRYFAIGLCAVAQLSRELDFISVGDEKRIAAVIAAHALPTRLRKPLPVAALMRAVARDKKNRAGLPRFVVLKKIGEAATQDGVALAMAEACFRSVGAG